jgi:endonuclease-3
MLPMLRDSESAAHRIRGALQGVFESTYSFDIDGMRKQNLGKAVDMLKNFSGSTPFAISWVIQVGLGGHSIPVSEGELEALRVLGIITEAEAAKYTVPGMERAIPKAKGVEFGVLLHQLGLAFRYSPYAPSLHKILLEIEPDCREDLPKRPSRTKAKPEPEKKPEPKKQPATKKKAAVSPAKAAKKKSASSSASKKTAAKKKPTKSKPAKKTTKKTPATKKPTTSKKTAKKKSAKRS